MSVNFSQSFVHLKVFFRFSSSLLYISLFNSLSLYYNATNDYSQPNRFINNNDEFPKSSACDENPSNENSQNTQNSCDTSNNNQLINWSFDNFICTDESEEKIYEDLCYVTISYPLEVSIHFLSYTFVRVCFLQLFFR